MSSTSDTQSAPRSRAGARARGHMLAGEGVSLGRLFGVKIELDWSLLIVFTLVAFNLGAAVLPAWHDDWPRALLWGVALAAAVLFFASILVHELSHALVARRYGVPVDRITLFMFGGVARMERNPPSPKAELAIAIVGPLTSIAIGVASLALGAELAGGSFRSTFEHAPPDAPTVREAMSHVGVLATLLLWLGPVNVVLGLFNVVPGFPLDGGRVLRALLWWGTGDLVKATRWASAAGRVVACLLIAAGVMQMFAGGVGQGLWLVLIGWFLLGAARASYAQVLAHRALAHVPVARVMWTQPRRVSPELSLDRFVQDYILGGDQGSVPVEGHDGELLGMIGFEDVRHVPQAAWPTTRVSEVMTPAARLTTLRPDAVAEQALETLAEADLDQVPVLENQRLQGILRMRDLLRFIALQDPSRRGGAPSR